MIRLLLCLFPLSLLGQYTVEGYVLDQVSGEPIPFVNVVLADNQRLGVLTNEKGQFSIKLDSLQRHRGTLSFSMLSYETETRYMGEHPIPPPGEKRLLNVRMSSSFLELPEIIVLSDLALRGLVRRALDKVPENYGADKFLLKAYARAYAVNDSAFASLSEAYLTYEDHRYGPGIEKPKVWIEQIRNRGGKDGQPPRLHPFFDQQVFLTGPYTWLSNSVRHGRLALGFGGQRRTLDKLTFRQIGEYLSGPDTLVRLRYEVNPTTHEKGKWPSPGSFTGEILINRTDYAILEHRFWTNGKKIYEDSAYQKIGGKYYLKRSSFSWDFESDFYGGLPHVFHAFYYLTEVITEPKAMRKAKKGRLLEWEEPITTMKMRYKEEFWQGEERLLQIPASETLRIQLRKIQEIPQVQDSTK
ncbi:MAG: carboxypeptidase-like regulatory domain-containing protein [Bacteroidota bacterium]